MTIAPAPGASRVPGAAAPRRSPARSRAARVAVAALGLLCCLGAAASAARETSLALTASEQGEISRLTIDAPKALAARIESGGNVLVLRVPKGTSVDLSGLEGRAPRRVASITPLPDGGLRIVATPGTRLEHRRVGSRILVELADATPRVAARPSAWRRLRGPRRRRTAPATLPLRPVLPRPRRRCRPSRRPRARLSGRVPPSAVHSAAPMRPAGRA